MDCNSPCQKQVNLGGRGGSKLEVSRYQLLVFILVGAGGLEVKQTLPIKNTLPLEGCRNRKLFLARGWGLQQQHTSENSGGLFV